MLHGFQKKILPIVLSLALILNLILIPGIHSQAASYSAVTSFTYNYGGYNYQFYYSGSTDVPDGYRFDSSALDYLLQKSAEGINISISSGIGAKISGILSSGLSSIFNLYRNFVIATDKLVADWIVWDDIYGFEFQFTGVDSSYPGFETYGSAYGWSFIGWLGEKIDLVLDSQGMLYGSNPIGNYTFSDDQLDLGRWSIHQYEAQGGEFWVPTAAPVSYQDLKAPYVVGKALHFFVYENGNEIEYIYPDFTRTVLAYVRYNVNSNFSYLGFIDSKFTTDSSSQRVIKATDNSVINPVWTRNAQFVYKGITYDSFVKLYNNQVLTDFNSLSISAPAFVYVDPYTSYMDNVNGLSNYVLYDQIHYQNCDLLWLDVLQTSPLPDPIVIPVDDPIPVSDIQPDPIEFTPDPDDEPDPVPGVDYPGDDPQPVPVPPLPPLVSGNDDLWPDMNGVFEVESEIDGFLGGLSNFEFTPLRTLVEGFSSSLIWVSTIMMALYNGSDFSILFVVLSIFFIAAALLGIYKWWTH